MSIDARIEVFEGWHLMPIALMVELFEPGKGSTLTVRCGQADEATPDPEGPSKMLEQLRGRLIEELPELPESVRQMVLRQALAQVSSCVEKGRRLAVASGRSVVHRDCPGLLDGMAAHIVEVEAF